MQSTGSIVTMAMLSLMVYIFLNAGAQISWNIYAITLCFQTKFDNYLLHIKNKLNSVPEDKVYSSDSQISYT